MEEKDVTNWNATFQKGNGVCGTCQGTGKFKREVCSNCKGTGICSTCEGTGYLEEKGADGSVNLHCNDCANNRNK